MINLQHFGRNLKYEKMIGILKGMRRSSAKPNQFSEARESMAHIAAVKMAAMKIASNEFMNPYGLPRFFPPSFNTFGHYFLFDYKLYLKIIYEAIFEAQEIVRKHDTLNSWVYYGGMLLSLLIVLFIPVELKLATFILAIGVPLVLLYNAKEKIKENINSEIAEYRANLVEQLISGNYEPNDNIKLPEDLEKKLDRWVGEGIIDDSAKTPLLIIYNQNHPFPGFGKLQLDNVFTCQPKADHTTIVFDLENIYEKTRNNLSKLLENSSLPLVQLGNVVAVHGESIMIDSEWLDENQTPVLHINSTIGINKILNFDPQSSARYYLAVQALLPVFDTAATFFIRIYNAGNAASFQIAISTLGPIEDDFSFVTKRLAKYQSELTYQSSESGRIQDIYETPMFDLLYLKSSNADEPPFKVEFDKERIEKLKVYESDSFKAYNYVSMYNEIVGNSAYWMGYKRYPNNLREINSLTFPSDFFGKPEAISTVSSLYEDISKCVLNSFEQLGYDISKYKNKDGMYSINADKIEQIIIGEKIEFSEGHKNNENDKQEKQ